MNFKKFSTQKSQLIKFGDGEFLHSHTVLKLALFINNHCFQVMVLVTDMVPDFDFILELESCIQLEAIYYLVVYVLEIQDRSMSSLWLAIAYKLLVLPNLRLYQSLILQMSIMLFDWHRFTNVLWHYSLL